MESYCTTFMGQKHALPDNVAQGKACGLIQRLANLLMKNRAENSRKHFLAFRLHAGFVMISNVFKDINSKHYKETL